ncbi:hypothetical protein [Miltoncostaea marina]|uniref:hypothetical protein n=1 Tax=Miltoncostaea marina TaxID=2843215 RepID=UPI001C3CE78E|nr:hypothetical protein [Miltoncostaea marina]
MPFLPNRPDPAMRRLMERGEIPANRAVQRASETGIYPADTPQQAADRATHRASGARVPAGPSPFRRRGR